MYKIRLIRGKIENAIDYIDEMLNDSSVSQELKTTLLKLREDLMSIYNKYFLRRYDER